MQKPSRLTLIEEAIAKAAGITVERLNSKIRERNAADARAAVWFVARDHLNYSFPFLAKLYERDHTTIMSGVKRMRKLKASEKILAGIKKVCPEALQGLPGPDEPRHVDDWKFGV